MGSWLSVIKEWIEFIWPFAKVAAWENGIRFTYVPTFWLPWISFIETHIYKYSSPRVVLIPVIGLRKFDARVITVDLKPGMHRKVPWIEEIESHSTVADTFEAQLQNITTKDGKSVTFKVSVVYEVFNVKKAMIEVHDYENSMMSLTMIHMARRLRKDNWDDVRTNQDAIETELRTQLHEESKKWGTRIKDVGLTSIVETEQFNRFQIDR